MPIILGIRHAQDNTPMNLTDFCKRSLFWVFFILSLSGPLHAEETEARRILSKLILANSEEQQAVTEELYDHGDQIIKEVIEGWRVGEVSIFDQDGNPIALLKRGEDSYEEISSGNSFSGGSESKINRTSRKLRKKLRNVVDFLDLSSNDPKERIDAAMKLGLTQKPDYVEVLQERINRQKDPEVKEAFEVALNISLLKNSDPSQKLQAVKDLGESASFPARDFIEALRVEASESDDDGASDLKEACVVALEKIDSEQKRVEFYGSLLRGLSTGSVLLLVSYGLAITFGLMGVINMAHGEFIAIGGYTAYVVQGIFEGTYGIGSTGYEWYFAFALPASFFVAAFFGILLERGVIQFLYNRPLESLLATWGISMIIQQVIRLKFGAANVAVSSPQWLFGSYEFYRVSMSYNRLFLIAFALFVIIATWLLLNKTRRGLHIRATMQNRPMASSLGIKSSRVNMMTFAYGSGLAGLAGAFLSQIGNVGPSMGQTYIVDSFMVVVVGGVGNLLGAALSSLGIGVIDQGLQPLLGPVMGKITVLFAIILFLQLRPGGLFPARTRSLDD
ncbi:MAG TPA: urea ABC transporter permease subunit UrtB [Verrucomicrobiales bacterium]|nr:urea ABC transporter permease subunit UrtB [Verrucomicrobiales bacterium]